MGVEQDSKQTGTGPVLHGNGKEKFVKDFVAAWLKVINADRLQ